MAVKVGKRKLLATAAVGGVALCAVFAWLLWETDGLLVVVLATVLATTLSLGWLLAESERRTRQLMLRLQRETSHNDSSRASDIQELDDRFVALDVRLHQLAQRVVRPPEHAEQLLRAINARFTRLELEQQRIIEANRADAEVFTDRIVDSVAASGQRTVESIDGSAERASAQATREARGLFRQIEALLSLYSSAQPETGLPPTRTWAASPDLLVYLYQAVRSRRPNWILECGSGVSTLVMAYALKANGAGRLVALEHLDDYRRQTLGWLAAHDLEAWAEVRLAPLEDVILEGEAWPWYSVEVLPKAVIDLLFVDGPPGATREHARFPALPLLAEQLSHDAVVILDDYSREGENNVAEQWSKLYPTMDMTVVGHEKGTVAFSRDGGGAGSA